MSQILLFLYPPGKTLIEV